MPRGSAARLGIIALALVLALSLGSLIVPGSGPRAAGLHSFGPTPLVLAAELDGIDLVDENGLGRGHGSRRLVELPEPERVWILDPDEAYTRPDTIGFAQDLKDWVTTGGGELESLPNLGSADDDRSAMSQLTWPELLDQLRDDDVRWNATYAAHELLLRLREEVDRPSRWEEVEKRLTSGDRQQEILVTGLLMRMVQRQAEEGGRLRRPHPVLCERAVDWLDGAPTTKLVPGLMPSRGLCTRVCMIHVTALHQKLGAIARQENHRARFRAAFVLGATERTGWSALAAEVLIPHLRSNRIQGDACMALYALKQLGPFVAPQLALARAEADPQQARCIDALLAECDELGSGAAVDLRGVSLRTNSPLEHWSYVPDWDSTRVAPFVWKD